MLDGDVATASEWNLSQKEASIKCTESSLGLIEGPPGTGKTQVVCSMLKWWSKHLQRELQADFNVLLATATSNKAVDNLALGCAKRNLKVVRLGGNRDEASLELRELMPTKGNMADRLGHADVVCTTPQGSCHQALVEHKVRILKVWSWFVTRNWYKKKN